VATNPIVINNISDLQAIQNNLSGDYVLGADIDAAGFNFTPIGSASNPFTGTFDGQGHTIDQLHTTTTQSYIGLFGYVGQTGIIRDVNLTNVNITSSTGIARTGIGAIAGWNEGTISNSTSSGVVGSSPSGSLGTV
jgi:hypothetical protein